MEKKKLLNWMENPQVKKRLMAEKEKKAKMAKMKNNSLFKD